MLDVVRRLTLEDENELYTTREGASLFVLESEVGMSPDAFNRELAEGACWPEDMGVGDSVIDLGLAVYTGTIGDI